MDARTFLGLEPTEDPRAWRLPVLPGLSTGGGFLFGGCGLAAAIEAMERTTGRPCVWATAQYLSHARPPEVLDIAVTEAVSGSSVTQARAIARVGPNEILTVNAALGRRDIAIEGEWAVRPDVPPPERCPKRDLSFRHHDKETVMRRIEVRIASGRQESEMDGTPGSGRNALWARMPDRMDMSAAALAILGDYVPSGIRQATGATTGGTSLDNTLRVARLVPTVWVLLDIRIHAVAHGFGHGLVHQWAEDGTLLATASQSAMIRMWPS
jgi:acyl-CoA thioesterase